MHLCPAFGDWPECPLDPHACTEACQLRPEVAAED